MSTTHHTFPSPLCVQLDDHTMTTPKVQCILMLDADGNRIAAKFFNPEMEEAQAQREFEKNVFAKTSRTNARNEAEIILFDNVVTVYRFTNDVHVFVSGGQEENELILATVLTALVEALTTLLRGQVEKRTLMDNLDMVLLLLDEVVDGGMILETDVPTLVSRVTMRGADGDVPLSEQTLSQAVGSFREQFLRSLRQ